MELWAPYILTSVFSAHFVEISHPWFSLSSQNPMLTPKNHLWNFRGQWEGVFFCRTWRGFFVLAKERTARATNRRELYIPPRVEDTVRRKPSDRHQATKLTKERCDWMISWTLDWFLELKDFLDSLMFVFFFPKNPQEPQYFDIFWRPP